MSNWHLTLILDRMRSAFNVGNILRIAEACGASEVIGCGADRPSCPRSAICLTRKAWMRAGQALYAELDSITVADLIKDARDCLQNGPGPAPQGDLPPDFATEM